jgi:transcriptional regulatory protein LevR
VQERAVSSLKYNKKIRHADDQILTTESGDKLQIAAHRLKNISKKYNLKISTSETKSMGICGNEIQRLNGDRRKNH